MIEAMATLERLFGAQQATIDEQAARGSARGRDPDPLRPQTVDIPEIEPIANDDRLRRVTGEISASTSDALCPRSRGARPSSDHRSQPGRITVARF